MKKLSLMGKMITVALIVALRGSTALSLVIALSGSTVVQAAEMIWTNGLANNVFTAGGNWVGGNAPGVNDLARIDLSGADRAIFSTVDGTHIFQRLRVGYTSGRTGQLDITGGYLRATQSTSEGTRVGAGGGTGTINQGGGTVEFGHLVDIGRFGSTGTYNLTGGLLDIWRSTAINGVQTSLQLGNGGGVGAMNITSGMVSARAGILLAGAQAVFSMVSTNIQDNAPVIISGKSGEGYWYQAAGSKLMATVRADHDAGLPTIEILKQDGTDSGGDVYFEQGAKLDFHFPTGWYGVWTVMKWDGELTNQGLQFIYNGGNVTNVWGTDRSGRTNALHIVRWNVADINQVRSFSTNSNDHFVMRPDRYVVDSRIGAGTNVFCWLRGTNTVWDFTGTTFFVNTNFYKIANAPMHTLVISGTNNTVTGLTVEDDTGGESLANFSFWRSVIKQTTHMVEVGGVGNILDRCTVIPKGSYPYGYGDMWGKGSDQFLPLKKKSAIRVSGKDVLVKHCTVRMFSFGHAIYLRGSRNAVISNCFVLGEIPVKTTDIRNEAGPNPVEAEYGSEFRLRNIHDPIYQDGTPYVTNHPASYNDLTSDVYIISKHEDGIRAYENGTEYGGSITNTTRDTAVYDCVVENMREGIKLSLGYGSNTIENSRVVGIDYCGFAAGHSGTIRRCIAENPYGLIFSTMEYSTVPGKNMNIDITIQNYYTNRISQTDVLARIAGSGHNIKIESGLDAPAPAKAGTIRIGGYEPPGWRTPYDSREFGGGNIQLTNYTRHAVSPAESGLTNVTVKSWVDFPGAAGVTKGIYTNLIPVVHSASVNPSSAPMTINGTLSGGANWWMSGSGDVNGFISYDLRALKEIGEIRIWWYGGHTNDYQYKVDVSDNGSNWSNTVPSKSSSFELQTRDSIGRKARYIRIQKTSVQDFRIREVDADIWD